MEPGSALSRRALMAGASVTLLVPVACRSQTRAIVSFLDYLPPSQHRLIASGRSVFDCAPNLGLALRETAAAGANLVIPRGVYMLAPAHPLAHADSNFTCLAAVPLLSGMRLHGEPGAVLRMQPGFSTDDRPRAMAMFGTTEALSDIEIRRLDLDMNGAANPISPGRRDRQFNRYPQAQIFVSSLPDAPTARIDRVRIDNTVFRNANGASCIVMAQTDDRKGVLGSGWHLERCDFLENGLDTDDHSSVFAYADDVAVTGCTFANTRPYDITGVNTAYEVHGSRQRLTGCTFSNMLRGVWIAGNYTSVTRGTVLEGNTFRTMFYGIDFFQDREQLQPVIGTTIQRNRFEFDDRAITVLPRLDFKAAVQVASEFGQQDIRISDNTVRKIGAAVSSAFLVVTGSASGERRHDNIEATNNTGEGLTFGSFIRTTPTAGLGRLTVQRNRWFDLTPSRTMSIAAGDMVEQTAAMQSIARLALGGGSVIDRRPSPRTTHGIFLNTTVVDFKVLPSETRGVTGDPFEIGGAGKVIGRSASD